MELGEDEPRELKNAVLATKTDNLRTVRFILDCYFEMRSHLGRALPPEATKFLVAMADHEARGKSETVAFYDFNPVAIYMDERSTKKGQKPGEQLQRSPQAEFYFHYFGENAPYRFVKCVFDAVKSGHFNTEEARKELFPDEAALSEPEKLALEIKDLHFFFAEDSYLENLNRRILEMLNIEPELSFEILFIFARGLSSSNRLLGLSEIKTLPPEFEKHFASAVIKVEEPQRWSTGLEMRGSEFYPIFVEKFKVCLEEELIRRQNEEVENALSVGSLDDLELKVLQNSQILRRVFSAGLVEKIWRADKISGEQKYRMIDALIKGLRLHSTHSPEIASQLNETHKFFTQRYNESKQKMERIRIFRLLESSGLALPQDIPPGITV